MGELKLSTWIRKVPAFLPCPNLISLKKKKKSGTTDIIGVNPEGKKDTY